MQVGAAIFEDGTKLYLAYDGLADKAMQPLFATEHAARDWIASRRQNADAPTLDEAAEEPVTIMLDVTPQAQGGLGMAGSFASRASRSAMWLTGPRSFLEMAYENGATASRTL